MPHGGAPAHAHRVEFSGSGRDFFRLWCAGLLLTAATLGLRGASAHQRSAAWFRGHTRIAGSPHIKMFRPVYDRPQLARIMASCDALIHGSEAEPFGLVASEAMASGLPLIVPETGGCAEVADPLTSETYRERDAADAALAIERMFAREPAILRKAAVVAAGRVRTDREHTIDLMNYYADRIAEKAGRTARLVA